MSEQARSISKYHRPCPTCGSTSSRSIHASGTCHNANECNKRRCKRRKANDRKRAEREGVREQCPATFGGTDNARIVSVRFCELRNAHHGLHLHGTHEWSGRP